MLTAELEVEKTEQKELKQDKNFEGFYQSELIPTLTLLEKDRKKHARACFVFIITPVIITLLSFRMAAHLEWTVAAILGLIFGIIGGGVFYLFYRKRMKALKTSYKQNIISRIIKFIDPSLYYAPENHISQSDYRKSNLFLQDVDRYSGDDLVSGTIGNTSIKFSEIHSEYKTESTDNKGNRKTSWHTIFEGIFFIADFNKHFLGETVVLPDVAERLLGRLGNLFQKANFNRGQLIKMEDPEFEKNFVVYGNDQVEARYILSPALMRRILQLKSKSGGVPYFSFNSSKVFIAISTRKNLFEPPFFRSMLNYKVTEEYHQYLCLCVSIVEELDLNTRIWTKH